MSKTLPDLSRLAPFVTGLGKAILREMIEDLTAEAGRDAPAGMVLVPVELTAEMRAAAKPCTTVTQLWSAMLAASPQPHPSRGLRDVLQQRCTDWGAYWRAADAHGVELTNDQAVDLLRTALDVEVAIGGAP